MIEQVISCPLLSMNTFLPKNNIPVSDHLPYSPSFAPWDFNLLLTVKYELEERKFQSVQDVKETTACIM